MYTKKKDNRNKRNKNQRHKKKNRSGSKKEMMLELMKLVKSKNYREAAPLGHNFVQSHGPDLTVFLMTAKCEIELGSFKQAHETLFRAEQIDQSDISVKLAFLNLFKKWGEHLEMGASMGMGVLETLLTSAEKESSKKILKIAKDTFDIILMINPKKIKKLVDQKQLVSVMENISVLLQDQDEAGTSFIRTFSEFSVRMIKSSMISSKQFSTVMWGLMPYLKDDDTRDSLFFNIVREFEMLEQKTEVFRFLNTKDESFLSLPSFTYFKLKYAMYWDSWLDHVKTLTMISNNTERYKHLPYFSNLVFFAQEFLDIFGKIQDLGFNLGIEIFENKIIEKFDKCLKKHKIKIKDTLKSNKKCYQIVNDEFSDDTIIHFLRKFETRPECSYEIVKRVILRRAIVEDIQDYVLKEICEYGKKWILNVTKDSDIVKFETFLFILDVEDFLGLSGVGFSDMKKIIDKLAGLDLGPLEKSIYDLEIMWKGIKMDQIEVLKGIKAVYDEILNDDELDFSQNPYLERRVIVCHNRLELLNLIIETHESENKQEQLEKVKQRIMDLNINLPNNIISQHNMAMALLLLDSRVEAGVILNKITQQNMTTMDETLARVYLSVQPENIDFILRYAEDFDTKAWYCYIRGLNHYRENEYGEAYDCLQMAQKKLRFQVRRLDYNPVAKTKFIINLTKLKTGRFSSKAIFSDQFIRQNCPVLFTERLLEDELQTHLNRVNCLIGVLNKLLAKPKSAINNFKDLIVEMTSKINSEDPEVGDDAPGQFDDIFMGLAKEYLNIQEQNIMKESISKIKKIENLEKRSVAVMAHGELALCYSYAEEFRNALLHLLVYSLSSKDDFCDLIVLESLLYFYKSLDTPTKPKFSGLVLDLIKKRYTSILDRIHSADTETSNYHQQALCLSIYVLFTMGTEEDILQIYQDERVTGVINDDSTDDSIGFNLKVMNPQAKSSDLVRDFSGNNKSWIFYFLKTDNTEQNLPKKIAALLLSLNINYDNQFIWTMLARLLNEMAMNKASYQSLNMARVFRIDSEADETQYSTLIWLKILRRVEFEARNQDRGEHIVQNLMEIVAGMNLEDNVHLREITKAEENIVKDRINSLEETSSEDIRKRLVVDFKREDYQQLVKRLILYILHLRQFDQENVTGVIKEFISQLRGDDELRESVMKAIKGYIFKHSSMYEILFLKNFTITINSLLIKTCLESQDDALLQFYNKNILNSISNLVLDQDDSESVLAELISFEGQGDNDNLKQLIDYCVRKQMGLEIGNEGQIFSIAKRCLYLHPNNQFVRFMSNSIFAIKGKFEGIFVYKDHEYSQENNFFEIISVKSALSGVEKLAKMKTGYFINPQNGIFGELMQQLRSSINQQQSENAEGGQDVENMDEKLQEIKANIMKNDFGITDEEEQQISAYAVWEATVDTTMEQSMKIQALAVIDCLQMFSRLEIVTQQELEEDELLEELSQKVLENSALNKIYFVPYLQCLYSQRRLEELEEWLGVLTYLKVPPKVEYLVNYHVLLLKIQEMSHNPDDQENDQILSELFTYFKDDCSYKEISTSAFAMEQVYKKYISQEITENGFKSNIQSILEKGGSRSLNVLKKFIN